MNSLKTEEDCLKQISEACVRLLQIYEDKKNVLFIERRKDSKKTLPSSADISELDPILKACVVTLEDRNQEKYKPSRFFYDLQQLKKRQSHIASFLDFVKRVGLGRYV